MREEADGILYLFGLLLLLLLFFFTITIIIIIITSSGDLQPSTAIANQLPGQLVSTQIRITGHKLFYIHHSIDGIQHRHCINS